MSTTNRDVVDVDVILRAGPLIGFCTLALTVSFLGIVALGSGATVGFGARLPWYVLASAVVFVASLLVLEHSVSTRRARRNGYATLRETVAATGVGFAFMTLGTEGMLYARLYPGRVVTSHLFVYLIAVAIVASGIGYWAARNVDELDDVFVA